MLLKVSGEALAGDGSQNIDPKVHCFTSDLRCMLIEQYFVDEHIFGFKSTERRLVAI